MELLIIEKNFIISKSNCGHDIVTNAVGAELPAQNELFGEMINGNVANSEAEFLLEEENK
jgi:hypothetical protein